jgi:F0F1-type ATP synthase assembly protein I
MTYFLIKTLVSALIIAAVSELSRRSTMFGAVLASLPLTSILAFVWLYRDTRNATAVAQLAQDILWLVIPSLVLFIVLPLLLKKQMPFYPALLLASLTTVAAYGLMLMLLTKLDMR